MPTKNKSSANIVANFEFPSKAKTLSNKDNSLLEFDAFFQFFNAESVYFDVILNRISN